ncbi:MAG: hypothetical protein Tp118SUR00d2C21406231_61 [Prokaryotic dsDNA virus sp.]|nr:MAG: hypothetical protein Tp125DCM00d2C40298531_2 [Prokaryotic dsDNA virus sp.]QDP53181.1 MAG: hypothetical protein Tp118SUR00d2C21406231_61 [Prokaryotic dsDNA virus sp.]|tara:strand:+ start:33619 stop:33909 length:291 start_codon:yes stop_codon:yes gene_type:complete
MKNPTPREAIESLTESLRMARVEVEKARAERDALQAKLAVAVEALQKLHHAVCGETGFAECVRRDSGKAYPWPALDIADTAARATLTADTQNGASQ